MKHNRMISAILAFLMILSTLTYPVFAVETDGTGSAVQSGVAATKQQTTASEDTVDYLSMVYTSPEQKIANMGKPVLTSADGRYELYLQATTGEVAYLDTVTGQTMFSNPYDIALLSRSSADDIKANLMSQVIIDHSADVYNSYEWCIMRDQLQIKFVNGGIRLEYAIGRLDARRLLPRLIEKSAFEEKIFDNFFSSEFEDLYAESEYSDQYSANYRQKVIIQDRMKAYYILKDPNADQTTRTLKQMQSDFKITKKMAVYVFAPDASEREKDEIEGYIKVFCPKYTFEELEKDHDLTEYTGTEKAPPIFHVALEYYMEDGGLKVRCPVGGLRYVESDYSINSLSILPYFGCGPYNSVDGISGQFNGYTFIPDGSGSIVRFEDFNDNLTRAITQVVYGQDCSYYTLNYEHQETVRLPVFGAVSSQDWKITDPTKIVGAVVEDPLTESDDKEADADEDDEAEAEEKDDAEAAEQEKELTPEEQEELQEEAKNAGISANVTHKETKGFFAVIEAGAEMSRITAETGGALHKYDTVYSSIILRASDSYDISEAISAADSALISTNSAKSYVGDYTIKYFLLNGDEEAQAAGLAENEYYEASYVGMAKVYRDYLEKKGVLSRLTDAEVDKDIPLYLESFGTIETDDTFLTFPITVQTPLTTFEDLKDMYENLKENGVTNINWKLSGFFNGGLSSSAPKKAKVEKKVGGADGFEDFLIYANENGFDVYPEFDFVFVNAEKNNIFTGFLKSKYLARGTDGSRYASKREYSSVYQTFQRTDSLVLSPIYYTTFFEKLSSKLDVFSMDSISASTLGGYLGGDYNNDEKAEMYLRDETLEFAQNVMEQMDEKYENVMTEFGNAYTLSYVTDVLDVPLDSSGFNYASDTVPFMGMVLHGYIQFSGQALNTVGDSRYELLRSIESGAYPYYILSAQNTNILKLDEEYSKYYSIDYSIWSDDLIATYKEMNDALHDLQTQRIVGHEFVSGQRNYSEKEWAKIDAEKQRIASRYPAGTEEYLKEMALVESKYIVDNNRIVKVTYENGAVFYLNFNNYDVVIEVNGESVTLDAEDFIRFDA